MREILFRGKRLGDGDWVDGSLFIDDKKDKHEILVGYVNYRVSWEVDPATVGQFTGLYDMHGKRVFEGDIVTGIDEIFGSPFCDGITGKIVYDETAFFIEPEDVRETQYLFNECAVYEVIGNIHDNPELLEGWRCG